MSILSGIGQQPPIFDTGGGGELVYYLLPTTVNTLTQPGNTINVYGSIDIPIGVYLVSFTVNIINLDSVPVDISVYLNNLTTNTTALSSQRLENFTLIAGQTFSQIFSAVAVCTLSGVSISNAITVDITSGAFTSTAPTLSTRNVSIVKIG